MKTLTANFNIKHILKEKKDSMVVGMCLMVLTGFGVLFLGAVPVVVMFGGFSNKSTNLGDGLALVAHTYIVGIIMYAILIICFAGKWFM